jgi:acyl carrier protein
MKAAFDKKFWFWILIAAAVVVLGEAVVILWSLSWYWAVVIFFPAFFCLGYVESKQKEKRTEEHFGGRPVFDETEFGRNYFPPDRAKIATRLRRILVNHVGVDISRMAPTDRFIEDLLMDDFDSMATVDFAIAIEKEFDIQIPDSAAEKMKTFQSVVDYVAEAVKNKTN